MADATPPSLAAIVYEDNVFPDDLMTDVLGMLRRADMRLGGVYQRRRDAHRSRCDLDLEVLSTGETYCIQEDRGSAARGCRLDTAVLAEVAVQVVQGLSDRPDLVLINKFGKEEAEGRGLRDIIGQAVCDNIPLLICVPARNLAAWRDFAAGLAVELRPETAAVLPWLQAWFGDRLDAALPQGAL